MPRFALELEYDGRAFLGTQAQAAELRTLQSCLDAAIRDLAGGPAAVRLGSRLDAGVSALALPADCQLEREWSPPVLGMALNARLPGDVAVRRAALVGDGWSAKHDAILRHYRYRVLHQPMRPVLDQAALWIRELSCPERLAEVAALIPGVHDLSGFACLRRDDSDEDDPHRDYTAAAWTAEAHGLGTLWTFRISGRGFLYKQVRGLVGAMLHIAQGREPVELFRTIIAAGRAAPRCGNIAPAHGLVLERVDYDPEPLWQAVSGLGE